MAGWERLSEVCPAVRDTRYAPFPKVWGGVGGMSPGSRGCCGLSRDLGRRFDACSLATTAAHALSGIPVLLSDSEN